MKNPFIYGVVVTGEHFIDRKKEIKELTEGLLGGQHVILYSPRKMGKSSLVEETFIRINKSKKAIAFRVNLQKVETKEAFASMLINETIKNTYSSIEKLGKELKVLFTKINVKVFIDKEGIIGIEPIFSKMTELLEDAIDFPEQVAKRKHKRIIIAFDEFQEIEKFNGIEIEKLFRAIIESHKDISYIFTGSERHMISLIFEAQDRPFYRFARFLELNPIPERYLRSFIINKFNETHKKITDDAVNRIINFSEGIPYYVQCLCHESWYLADKEITEQTINEALFEKMLPVLSLGFEIIWNKIRSEIQRKLLLGMANEDKKVDYSIKFISKYNLKSSSHVNKAIIALEKLGLVYNRQIADFFFRDWIKRYKTF